MEGLKENYEDKLGNFGRALTLIIIILAIYFPKLHQRRKHTISNLAFTFTSDNLV